MSVNYIKGLDGLRGLAAILVILGHIEYVKKILNFKNMFDGGGPFFLYLGDLSVTFFFVLSGFLITFLLLNEKNKTGNLKIKNFYIKRALRIWPVYYLLFICGFLLFPLFSSTIFKIPQDIKSENFWNGFIYNILLLPNFSKISNPVAFQSWSIGVEEQFYIFWPLLILKIKSIKKLLITMILIVIIIYIFRTGSFLNNYLDLKIPFLETLTNYFGQSRFDNMAIGGILAIFYMKNPNLKIVFIHKLILSLLILSLSLNLLKNSFGLENPIAAIVFAGLIYWVISIENHLFLENKTMIFFGKISYGIYMYHIISIILSVNIILYLVPNFDGSSLIHNLYLYFSSIIITILISTVSYNFMEKRILKIKERL